MEPCTLVWAAKDGLQRQGNNPNLIWENWVKEEFLGLRHLSDRIDEVK